jgi:Ca-activated chloride channel family protein
MSFATPLFLLGLLLLPLFWLFLLAAMRSRQRALLRLGDEHLLTRLSASVNWRGRRWRQRLWLLGVGLLVLALARPRWGVATQVVQQEGVQVMVALDVSNSMLAQDARPDRLTRAKQTIVELMDALNGDEVGLVLFSGASFVQFPLTSDYATARSFLDAAQPGVISRPGTVIGDAIRTAEQGFDAQRATQKVIVIMTDGEDHETDPVAAAQEVAENGTIIYAIGFGSPDGEPIPEYDAFGTIIGYKKDRDGQVVLSQLNEQALLDIVGAAGGSYYRASASGREIGQLVDEIDQLEAGRLANRFEVQAIERYQLFVGLALVALVGAELIPDRRGRQLA